jgi:formate hydrogenlyase subunit 3/multisubunit Na+/H+ antiporter MnhD subunit
MKNVNETNGVNSIIELLLFMVMIVSAVGCMLSFAQENLTNLFVFFGVFLMSTAMTIFHLNDIKK